jgi:DNA mismatch repair protein MutS
MHFTTDQQTLDDLGILGKRGEGSIYLIFNRTLTRGGAGLLEEMFRYPLPDAETINKRSGIIQYFAAIGAVFPFQSELFDIAEQYLHNTDERTKLVADGQTLGGKLTNLIGADAEYKTLYKGVMAVIEIIQVLRDFIDSIGPAAVRAGSPAAVAAPYEADRAVIIQLLADAALDPILKEDPKRKLSYPRVADYDVLLRFRHRNAIKRILNHVYYLDVYMAVARVALERKFIFAQALPGEQLFLNLEGVYHPQLKDPVPNTLCMTRDSNVLFLTGANMAGKSTFMKSLGVALFLAHMGFPVPAVSMEFSALDGMYTTINLPDNLGTGASHFYAEVLRVKEVAKELSMSKRLFVLFDEMFRGTNVKDAYEATIAITSAFAGKRSSLFVISTHIIEAGEVLGERCGNIRHQYLPTHMNGQVPEYTYTLETGITADRHGMVIIENEGILDILKNGKKKIV